jgi:phosphopantothenoylcysteine synthetase/decarboxylase
VTFLYARGSKCPHELRIDLNKGAFQATALLNEHLLFLDAHKKCYTPLEYADFKDYERLLLCCLKEPYDIVVLAAAVSDYAPIKKEGKISSELDKLTIELEKTPKLIRQVKTILPNTFLVGFKLLVGSTQVELEDAMAGQMHKARCDMVVGNDLRDIKAAQHKLTILSIDWHFVELGPMPGADLARELAKGIIQDTDTINGRNRHLGA